MGRKTVDGQDVIARGCVRALQLAGDANRLADAPCEQLAVAAAFLARALARFEDGPAIGFRGADSLQELEAAGRAIGAEMRRRHGTVAEATITLGSEGARRGRL
jgi:hypothetical protein